MAWTNDYHLAERHYQSLFAMSSLKFEGKGFLVISRTGELI
jgi:hypothetical protein